MQHIAVAAGIALPMDAPPERSTKARNGRRALRWREDVERAAGAALARAVTPAEQDAVETAHAAEVKAGPDWTRIRSGSEYRTPVACRDRNRLARVLVYMQRLERENWLKDRAVAEHEQRRIRRSIGRCVRPVLVALIGLAKRFTHVFPSLERLAALALCSRRAVVDALETLQEIGLVVVQRRRKRVTTALGLAREVQATNAYEIVAPSEIEARRPRVSAEMDGRRHLSAREAKQTPPHTCAVEEEGRVAEAPRPPSGGPTKGHDWRAQSREALNRATRRWQGRP